MSYLLCSHTNSFENVSSIRCNFFDTCLLHSLSLLLECLARISLSLSHSLECIAAKFTLSLTCSNVLPRNSLSLTHLNVLPRISLSLSLARMYWREFHSLSHSLECIAANFTISLTPRQSFQLYACFCTTFTGLGLVKIKFRSPKF